MKYIDLQREHTFYEPLLRVSEVWGSYLLSQIFLKYTNLQKPYFARNRPPGVRGLRIILYRIAANIHIRSKTCLSPKPRAGGGLGINIFFKLWEISRFAKKPTFYGFHPRGLKVSFFSQIDWNVKNGKDTCFSWNLCSGHLIISEICKVCTYLQRCTYLCRGLNSCTNFCTLP